MSICSNNEEEDESRNNIFSIYNFITNIGILHHKKGKLRILLQHSV